MPPANIAAGVVRDRLNARYRGGRGGTNNLHEAGVLIHMLDGAVDDARPWLGVREFLSASLLSLSKRPHVLYNKNSAFGLVLSPASRLLCSYPQDSGSVSWKGSKAAIDPVSGRALPGCGPALCNEHSATPPPFRDRGYPCAFPPSMLGAMVSVFLAASADQAGYTEVIVSAAAGDFAIEAVLLPEKEGKGPSGRAVHTSTLEHFGLTRAQLPLLMLGPGYKGTGPLFVDAA